MANLKIYKFDHVVISLSGILSIISRRKQLSSRLAGVKYLPCQSLVRGFTPIFLPSCKRTRLQKPCTCLFFPVFFAFFCQDKWRRSYASRWSSCLDWFFFIFHCFWTRWHPMKTHIKFWVYLAQQAPVKSKELTRKWQETGKFFTKTSLLDLLFILLSKQGNILMCILNSYWEARRTALFKTTALQKKDIFCLFTRCSCSLS